ncbi:protein TolA [Luminiphilus syltensis NOR5-1B]|uniref:Protein TolA n=1 Tax=Luminiphilus syltensis NOR5-1B TaxID=565045 RepID=B8KS61_9GAMM|nr:energy transducer TonB [Luminiphilus syltensis]EED34337.1 protein TolA [Luminiphilus syltensis NOR5-1B]
MDRTFYIGFPLAATVLLHAVLIAFLTLRWPETKTVIAATPKPRAIQATIISAEQLRPKKQPPAPKATPKKKAPAPKKTPPKPKPQPKKQAPPPDTTVKQKPPEPTPEPKPEFTETELAALTRTEMDAVLDRETTAAAGTNASMTDTVAAVIQQAVVSRWTRPPSARNGMVARLEIQLVPTGDVVGVSVLQSSGNTAFDRSAISAVERAGRFPEVAQLKPNLFERDFRRFQLIFRPEDLRY